MNRYIVFKYQGRDKIYLTGPNGVYSWTENRFFAQVFNEELANRIARENQAWKERE